MINLLLLQICTGLSMGAVYVLMAVGLSLIFGMLSIVNFAHGAFYMVGAYAALSLGERVAGFWGALILAPLAVAAVGALAERLFLRPLYGKGIDYPLLLTFGLAYMLIDAVRFVYGRQGLSFGTPEALQGAIDLGFGHFPLYRLFLIAVTTLILGAVWLTIERSRLGLIIRSAARDPGMVQVLGINIDHLRVTVFAVGTALAALAGALVAPMQGVTPEMGESILAESFAVTVLGGMGSLTGAVAAGLMVGMVSSLTALFAPAWTQVSMYILMTLILLVRPRGLFGKAGVMA